MAEKRNEYSYMSGWLQELGFTPDTRMSSLIDAWWGWFVSDNDFYHYRQRKLFRLIKMERMTMHPAAFAAEAWSDLLMTERTTISSDDPNMQAFITDQFANFAIDSADLITRSFALGTGAWALNFEAVSNDGLVHPGAVVEAIEYDASQILPLTWSAKDCDQCAFVARVEYGGKDYDQCQAHVLIGGTYHILTQLFDVKTHKRVYVDGIMSDFNTGSTYPTFALIKPATVNKHFNYCAFGASIFERGIDAIKLVDEAFTSFHRHLRVGGTKVFVDETMIEKVKRTTSDGKILTEYAAFGEADDMVFRMKPGGEGASQMQVVQPDLKVDENANAINDALKILSIECGFGNGYFSWDEHKGLKTAKEVISDNSMLARTLRRHQNALRVSIERLVRGMAACCNSIMAAGINLEAPIHIDFDDSVIVDTETEKQTALTEIAALGIPELKQKYLVRYCNFTPEEAAAAIPTEQIVDEGF